MHEDIVESVSYQKGYDKGFADAVERLGNEFDKAYEKGFNKGWQKNEYQNKWVNIEDELPEKGRRLLYYFESCGVFLGFYLGIDSNYCPETGHVFASSAGYLTGDVTHWQYMAEYPQNNEELVKADIDYCKSLIEEVENCKSEMSNNSNHE
tara:strand:- start:543 stop:995 length:453 start_codon:yes stop_codon:yes gene_type:complete